MTRLLINYKLLSPIIALCLSVVLAGELQAKQSPKNSSEKISGERQLPQIRSKRTGKNKQDKEVDFTYRGKAHRMVLTPRSVRSKNFKVTVVDSNGVHRTEQVVPPELFQGYLEDDPDAKIAARIDNGQVTAYIKLPNGEVLGIEPDKALGGLHHTVYSSDDIPSTPVTCGVMAPSQPTLSPTPSESQDSPAVAAASGSPTYVVDIAFDADYEFFAKNSFSVAATVADIESVMNGVNTIYERDVNITYNITEIIVRDSSITNPYSSNDAETLLDQFNLYWEANYSFGANTIERDLAHLMTGRSLNGSTIGLAYVGIVCDSPSLSYGLSESRYNFIVTYAQRVALTAHELGHNWNADHCACNIMCDTIGGCTGVLTQFSQTTINTITSFRDNNLGCLEIFTEPGATDDHFVAASNRSLDLDVLKNDAEFFNLPYTITSITQPSNGSASVNPDQTIHYISNELYTGSDSFTYSITNTLNGPFTATVNLTIGSGINYDYYEGNFIVMPIFSVLTPTASGATGAFNLDPAERNFDFAMRFKSTLNVPTFSSYSFFLEGQYNARLFIDGFQRIATGTGSAATYSTSIPLTSGAHDIEVQYFYNYLNPGPSHLDLEWSSLQIPRQAIGLQYLDLGNPNLSPVALDDNGYTIENSPITVQVLTNDYDPEGISIELATNSTPLGGSASISGSGILYTPSVDFNGTEQIQYTIRDNFGATNSATLEILVDTDTDLDTIYNAFDPDDDNDGLTDEEEAITGTSSTNSQSFFMAEIDNAPAVSFIGISGRRYQVQYKINLSDPTWLNVGSEVNGNGTLIHVPTTNTNDAAYYRVGVRLIP